MKDIAEVKKITRRTMMFESLALGSALFLGSPLPAFAIAPLPPRHNQVINTQLFLLLSTILTGHDDLDKHLNKTLFAALNEAGHEHALNLLFDAVSLAGNDAKAITIAAEKHTDITRALLRGWYVGLVRMQDGKDKLVGYQQTLVGAVINDFIPLRSNCGGAPHFWTKPPSQS